MKNTKKWRGYQKERATCETRYPSSPIKDFKVKNILFKTPLDFFNFIDLQPRYRNPSIPHPFNFKIPVITEFSRGTEGYRKQLFHVRACVWVKERERAVHADLKVEAGLKLKKMMEHTRMPITHACTPLTLIPHARTRVERESHSHHARKPNMHATHTHATHARIPCTPRT